MEIYAQIKFQVKNNMQDSSDLSCQEIFQLKKIKNEYVWSEVARLTKHQYSFEVDDRIDMLAWITNRSLIKFFPKHLEQENVVQEK